jgi:hypothetical protein
MALVKFDTSVLPGVAGESSEFKVTRAFLSSFAANWKLNSRIGMFPQVLPSHADLA